MDDAAKRQRITQNAAEIKKLKALVAAMKAKGLGGSNAGKPTRDWGFYCAIATCCVVPPITALLATRGKGQVVSSAGQLQYPHTSLSHFPCLCCDANR